MKPSGGIHVLCALAGEAATLASAAASRGGGLSVSVCGMGPARARRAAERILAGGSDGARPHLLVSWGLAGALAPDLEPGALVLPARVNDEGGGTWSLPGAGRRGALLSVSHPAGGRDIKSRLRQSSGCDAVDMESAGIADVCATHGVGFVAVRAIVDPAHRSLPHWLPELVDEDGRASPVALARHLARDPGSISSLVRCMTDYRCALRALRQAARRLPQILQGLA